MKYKLSTYFEEKHQIKSPNEFTLSTNKQILIKCLMAKGFDDNLQKL